MLVHPVEERTHLFSMLFLHCQAAAVSMLLMEDDQEDSQEDICALADKADRCAASINCHQQLLPVSAATADDCEDGEEQPYTLSQRSQGGQNRPKGGRGGQCPQYNGGSIQQEPSRPVCAAITSSMVTRPTIAASIAA